MVSGMGLTCTGKIGIIDYDTVDRSNLHRQVLHLESSVGIPKTTSIKNELLKYVIMQQLNSYNNRRNSTLNCIAYNDLFTSDNALQLVALYPVVFKQRQGGCIANGCRLISTWGFGQILCPTNG